MRERLALIFPAWKKGSSRMTRVLRCSSAAQPGEKKKITQSRAGLLRASKTQPSDYSTRKINHHILITQKRKWTNRKNFKNFGTPKSCERKKIEIYKKRRENEGLCCFFPGRRMLKSRWTCFLACRQRTVRFIDRWFKLRYSIFEENVRIYTFHCFMIQSVGKPKFFENFIHPEYIVGQSFWNFRNLI